MKAKGSVVPSSTMRNSRNPNFGSLLKILEDSPRVYLTHMVTWTAIFYAESFFILPPGLYIRCEEVVMCTLMMVDKNRDTNTCESWRLGAK